MKNLLLLFTLFLSANIISAQFGEAEFISATFPSGLKDIKTGDIDNDGLEDLVFAFNKNISWSKNIDGAGNWSTNQLIDLRLSESREIQLADFNGDGWLDVVVVVVYDGSNDAWAEWYRNEGDGQFSEAIILEELENSSGGNRVVSVGAMDLDNDGDLDIAAAFAMGNPSLQAIKWYENENGLGSFSEGIVLADGINEPWDLHLVQANNDEYIDLVFTLEGDSIMMMENLTGGNFAAPTTLAIPSLELIDIALGDMDGDGDMDIMGGTRYADRIFYYENLDNNGGFSTESLISEGLYSPSSILTTDIDGDLDLDIVYVGGTDGQLAHLNNLDGAANFSAPILADTSLGNSSFKELVVFDMDNDNDLDAIAAGHLYDSYLMFSNIDGQGNFEMEQPLNMSANGEDNERHMADIDGDGNPDMVVVTDEPYVISWLKYNSVLDLFEKPRNIPIAPPTSVVSEYQVIIFDVNNDGANDIIYNKVLGNKFTWLINDGAGNFTEGGIIDSGNGDLEFHATDLDNDGYIDLIINSRGVVGTGLYWYRNLGTPNGSFGAAEYLYSSDAVRFLEIVDYDGDGLLDLFPILEDNADIGWIKNNGNSFTPWVALIDLTSKPREILVEDMNNDGFLDIFIARTDGALGIKYYKATSLNSFEPVTDLSDGTSNRKLHVIDYDLDGLNDLLFLHNGVTLKWHKNTNDNTAFLPEETIVLGNGLTSFLILQDLNSDGDKDIVYGNYLATYYRSNLAGNSNIVARAFYDLNSNGLLDAGEPGLNNFQFNLEPNELLYFTANDSASVFYINEGTYTLNSYPLNGWDLTSGDSSCEVTVAQDSFTQKWFPYYPTNLFSSINTDLTSAPTRCGFTVPFWLAYTNEGTTVSDGLIALSGLDNATFLTATPTPDSIVGDTMYWFVNGLAPTHSESINLEFEIADANSIGDTVRLTSDAYVLSAGNQYEFSYSYDFKSEINCAYDPNDKQVMPAGFFDQNYTLFDEVFTYNIRFQNTGTDTAFNINITDVLDADLDWNTLRIISSSHQMETSLNQQTGLLNFSFSNILLPDSMVNEVASHGFVKYEIEGKPNLLEGTTIENYANIFFDFNPPILTNTTLNTLVSEYPIIVTESLTNLLCAATPGGIIDLDVYAIEPITYTWNYPNLMGPFNENLLSGIYELTITDGTGSTNTLSYTLTEPLALESEMSSSPQIGTMGGTATVMATGGTAPYMYHWNSTPPQNEAIATDLEAGEYIVTITDSNGCEQIDSVSVDFTSSLSEIGKAISFEIFPNPTTGVFSIVFESEINEALEMEITDVSGREIYKEHILNNSPVIIINQTKVILSKGFYFIKVTTEGRSMFKKLIVLE